MPLIHGFMYMCRGRPSAVAAIIFLIASRPANVPRPTTSKTPSDRKQSANASGSLDRSRSSSGSADPGSPPGRRRRRLRSTEPPRFGVRRRVPTGGLVIHTWVPAPTVRTSPACHARNPRLDCACDQRARSAAGAPATGGRDARSMRRAVNIDDLRRASGAGCPGWSATSSKEDAEDEFTLRENRRGGRSRSRDGGWAGGGVEPVGVGELLAGRGWPSLEQVHLVALVGWCAPQLDVGRGPAPPLGRSVEAQQLLDRARPDAGVVDQTASWSGWRSSASVPLPIRLVVVSCPPNSSSVQVETISSSVRLSSFSSGVRRGR